MNLILVFIEGQCINGLGCFQIVSHQTYLLESSKEYSHLPGAFILSKGAEKNKLLIKRDKQIYFDQLGLIFP